MVQTWHKIIKLLIIYLIGKPGVGKYTIAKEIAKQSRYILCDNYLLNNLIFSLLDLNQNTTSQALITIPDAAWDTISKIRSNVLDFISNEHNNNYIFTNVLYNMQEDIEIYSQVATTALKRKSLFIPVKLAIEKSEHIKRITQLSRKALYKTIDPKHVNLQDDLIIINDNNLLALDITNFSAKQTAQAILKHVSKIMYSNLICIKC